VVRSYLAAILLGTALVGGLTGCTGSRMSDARSGEPAKIRIAVTSFPASAPVYVAVKNGYFADEGLNADVQVYDAGIEALDDVIDGKVDFATVAETPIARAALENRPFGILMTMAEIDRANYIIARRDRGISSTADLKGRRIGFVQGSTADFFLHIYLTAARIPVSAIKEVKLKPGESATALLEGRVDAVSTWPPFTSQLKKQLRDRAVVLDEPGLYTMSWNLVSGAGAREPSHEVQRRVIRALGRAEEYMAAHPSDSVAIVSRACDLDPGDLRSQWGDYEWRTALDQTLLLSLEDEARWMIDTKQVKGAKRTPDFLRYVQSAALRAQFPSDVSIIEPQGR